MMKNERAVYPIEIAGVKRDLVLFQIKPGLKIAILNILGDTELVQACAKALNEKLGSVEYDVVVTSEAKSIPLAHALSVENKKPYVILRKAYKPYMGEALQAETLSITTGEPQTLYLQGMRLILQHADATIAAEAAILTEGERAKWSSIISLGHLPVFSD
jgi:adenine phosphoribosyltransferase